MQNNRNSPKGKIPEQKVSKTAWCFNKDVKSEIPNKGKNEKPPVTFEISMEHAFVILGIKIYSASI